jgi:hypothetical protein
VLSFFPFFLFKAVGGQPLFKTVGAGKKLNHILNFLQNETGN